MTCALLLGTASQFSLSRLSAPMEMDVPASTDSDANIEVLTALGSQLIKAILEFAPFQGIKALVDAGAPLWYEESTEGGISPLHAACFIENDELVKFLIDRGAIWNAGKAPSHLKSG